MNTSQTIFVVSVLLGCVYCSPVPAASKHSKTSPENLSTRNNRHFTERRSFHKSHGKSHKRHHVRKKKQFIIPGFGGGLGAGLAGYGYNYPLPGYSPANGAAYGLATGSPESAQVGGLVPSGPTLQSQQNLLDAYARGRGLSSYGNDGSSYSNGGMSSYGNGGMSSYAGSPGLNGLSNSMSAGYDSKLSNELGNGLSNGYSNSLSNGLTNSLSNGLTNSLSNGYSNSLSNGLTNSDLSNGLTNSFSNGLTNSLSNGLTNSLSNGLTNSLSNGLTNSLSNGLTNSLSNGLTNSLSNGIGNGLNSYSAGNDANSYGNANGLNSLASSYSQGGGGTDTNSIAGGGKYAAASLSAGLDSPNGITNIADLLNSASTSFDTDSQSQVVSSNKDLAHRFGSQSSGAIAGQSAAPYSNQQSTFAEAQAFGNQLSHLSPGKINLGSNNHASYGGFGDGVDSNSLNEIGQIASTGISDSSLQRLLGQLMAGQMGRHASSAGLGSLPSDAGVYDQGNSESLGSQPSEASDDGSMMSNSLLSPVMHGQTVHAHASDKPNFADSQEDKVKSAASLKAFNVQVQANREHQKKLSNLKEKLRMLREKLRKLKTDYEDDGNDESEVDQTSELSEKSEMDSLDDLKKATEDAISELQNESFKTTKRKGGKKFIFIHKYPGQSESSNSDSTGKKKGIGELGTELMELIEDDTSQSTPGKSSRKKGNPAKSHQDDTQSLTELEKQAEQEVNFLTSKNPKVVRKHRTRHQRPAHNAINPGLHINIPEPIDERETHFRMKKPKKPFSSFSDHSHLHVRHRTKPLLHSRQSFGQKKLIRLHGLNGIHKRLPSAQQPIMQHDVPSGDQKAYRYNSLGSKPTTRTNHSLGFFSVGCWRDQPERALTSLEGIFPILDGNDYMHRKFAIRKCAQVARVQGFSAFAIENGGHCLGGKNILQTYSMYGSSRACRQDGRGGPWSMEVYKFIASSNNPKNRRGDIAIGLESVRDLFYKNQM